MELQNPTPGGFLSSSSTNILFLLPVLVALTMNLSINHASASKQFQNETDRLALLEFKLQIDDDPYGVLNSWNHSQHHCQWQGVTCDTRHRRVTALALGGKSLSGTISPHIGNLSFMKFIYLGGNQFHDEIPHDVGRLFRLRELNLSSNVLTGEIPANLSSCSKMRTVSLFGNKLVGKLPTELTNLKNLEILHLYKNNLTGKIPSSIGNLSSLIELSFTYNNFEGNLPKEMGLLRSLNALEVGANKLSGIIPASIFNISALAFFEVAKNSFHGKLPSNIGLTLPNLKVLLVGVNSFSGNIPISITNASGLELLNLPENNFEGKVPTNLGVLPDLQRLNLEKNSFGGDLEFIVSLTNNSNLSEVFLGFNNFGGEIPKAMANLSHQLTQLVLTDNQLSGTIPEGLGKLVNLIIFDASWNSLSGTIPSDFGKFQKLQYLALQKNRLSGEIPSTLCNATMLFLLGLHDNQFEGSNIFDNILMNCQNLQKLHISRNKLDGFISPHFFETHSSLLLLSLGENAFSGSLPLEVGKLRQLVIFDVSYNNFSEAIPMTIGDLSKLEVLFMQGNLFQGIIPQNLVSLTGIQQLNLSSNHLTGQKPKDLEKLQFLEYLDLSNNDLNGEIPTAGVFVNASQISLNGNNKLCGGIPELDFPSCPLIKGKKKGKATVIIVLSTVLPAAVLVLAMLAISVLIYRKRAGRRASSTSTPTTVVDKLLRLSYHELHRATSGFSPENFVGSGGFGVVYKGRLDDQHGNRLVAIKVLDLQKKGAAKSFKAECKALRSIRHKNLVSVLSYTSSIDSRGLEFKALVYEFMENGNLDLWLHPDTHEKMRSRNLNLLQRLTIAIDVASALDYLHNQCQVAVVHCDLKPSNILLDNDLTAHVGDFGLARLLAETTNSFSDQGTSSSIAIKGSFGYAAPEYGMGHQVSAQGDVYSYGILLLEMFTGKRPTNDMFMDGLDLHNYVEKALPNQVFKIVDPLLLSEGREIGDVDTQVKLNNDENEMECLTSIFRIGVHCSAALPNDRMPTNDIVRKLYHIRDGFVDVKIEPSQP